MSRALAYWVLSAAAAFVIAPALTGGFAGFAPDAFPVPQDRPPVQPAGWAFAIWGPIYLWLVAHAAFGLRRRVEAADWVATRAPLLLSLAIGAGWIAVARLSPGAATVLIWAMLATALLALRAAGPRDPWLLRAPLGLYAGWLTAASWVSVGLMLAGYGWMGERAAAVLCLAGAVAVALAVLWRLPGRPSYAVAVVWALAGVTVANADDTALAALAAAGAVAVGAAGVWRARG